jgi:hypothetical protein
MRSHDNWKYLDPIPFPKDWKYLYLHFSSRRMIGPMAESADAAAKICAAERI